MFFLVDVKYDSQMSTGSRHLSLHNHIGPSTIRSLLGLAVYNEHKRFLINVFWQTLYWNIACLTQYFILPNEGSPHTSLVETAINKSPTV